MTEWGFHEELFSSSDYTNDSYSYSSGENKK
jgi:hypothetical protein